MAYQRVTLGALEDRLAERLGGEETFWSEPERRAAINESLALWQLLTGEFVATTTQSLVPGTQYVTYTAAADPAATFLRVRCDPCGMQLAASATTSGGTSVFLFTPTISYATPDYTYVWDLGEVTPRLPTTDLFAYWSLTATSGTRVLTAGSATSANLAEVGGTVPAGSTRPNHTDEGSIASVWTSPDTTPKLFVEPTPSDPLVGGVTIACWFKMRSDSLPTSAQMNMFTIMGDTTLPATSNYILSAYRYCVGTDTNFIGLGHTKDGVGDTGIAPAVVGSFSADTWHHMCAWWRADDYTIAIQIDGGPVHYAAGFDFSSFPVAQIHFGGGVGNRLAWHGDLAKPAIWLRVLSSIERANLALDGFSTEATPLHVFTESGTYTATVTVTDTYTCTGTATVSFVATYGGPPT